jgi:hypothetical protein
MLNKIWDWLFEPTPVYSEPTLRRMYRDMELQEARMQFILRHHREPSARELWELSDPFGLEG